MPAPSGDKTSLARSAARRKPAPKRKKPGGKVRTPRPAARERLLTAASDLFCRYGINATGVDAIVQSAGAAKATLYSAFGSKEGLVESVLEAEGKAWRDWFITGIDEHAGASADKLAHAFTLLEDWFARDRFFGCPFINAVGEFDKHDERFRRVALRHKSIVMGKIIELARATSKHAPEQLAHSIGLLIDGAIVTAMVTRDPAAARYAREAAIRLCASRN
ncbi:MAG: TetR/AcrR family transcriptional regulator [Alphaproteobacteria bacterium]|nr:TetR/AcrR family transcriptional regulator [Alphaproteobacteria bacterium]